jgi:hypothetical protein
MTDYRRTDTLAKRRWLIEERGVCCEGGATMAIEVAMQPVIPSPSGERF